MNIPRAEKRSVSDCVVGGAALLVAALLACALLFVGVAYATPADSDLRVEVNDDLTVVAQVDEGVLGVQEFEINGKVVVVEPEVTESEEVLIALAAAYNGWYKSNTGDWFYFVDGKWVTGWYKIGGQWFKFDRTGKMLTGWQADSKYWYYLRTAPNVPTAGTHGAPVTGWVSIGGYWYLFDKNGAMCKGWHAENGNWYYLRTAKNTPSSGPEGSMVANSWQWIGKSWYAFKPGGQMRTGWFKSGNYWYYLADKEVGISFNASDYGKMLLGLYKIGLYEYYFYDSLHMAGYIEPDGAMLRSTGYIQILTPDGFLVVAFIDSEGHVYRGSLPFSVDGDQALDTQSISEANQSN